MDSMTCDIINRGYEEASKGNFKSAIEWFSSALDANDKDFVSVCHRSLCFFQLHRFPEALADAEKAISLNSSDSKGYFLQARALVALKRYSEAERAFMTASNLSSEDRMKDEIDKELLTVRYLMSKPNSSPGFLVNGKSFFGSNNNSNNSSSPPGKESLSLKSLSLDTGASVVSSDSGHSSPDRDVGITVGSSSLNDKDNHHHPLVVATTSSSNCSQILGGLMPVLNSSMSSSQMPSSSSSVCDLRMNPVSSSAAPSSSTNGSSSLSSNASSLFVSNAASLSSPLESNSILSYTFSSGSNNNRVHHQDSNHMMPNNNAAQEESSKNIISNKSASSSSSPFIGGWPTNLSQSFQSSLNSNMTGYSANTNNASSSPLWEDYHQSLSSTLRDINSSGLWSSSSTSPSSVTDSSSSLWGSSFVTPTTRSLAYSSLSSPFMPLETSSSSSSTSSVNQMKKSSSHALDSVTASSSFVPSLISSSNAWSDQRNHHGNGMHSEFNGGINGGNNNGFNAYRSNNKINGFGSYNNNSHQYNQYNPNAVSRVIRGSSSGPFSGYNNNNNNNSHQMHHHSNVHRIQSSLHHPSSSSSSMQSQPQSMITNGVKNYSSAQNNQHSFYSSASSSPVNCSSPVVTSLSPVNGSSSTGDFARVQNILQFQAVFVDNVSPVCKPEDLFSIFSVYGRVTGVEVKPVLGNVPTFACIEFADSESPENAVTDAINNPMMKDGINFDLKTPVSVKFTPDRNQRRALSTGCQARNWAQSMIERSGECFEWRFNSSCSLGKNCYRKHIVKHRQIDTLKSFTL